MSLKEYIDGLTTVKREVLLGRETADALHGAFAAKRVVHAGLPPAMLERMLGKAAL